MHKLFLQRSCYWRLYKSNCFTCGGRYNTMLYQHFVSILNQSATYTEYHFRSNSNSNSNVKSNANQFNPNPRGLDIHIDSNSTQMSGNTNKDSTSYQVRCSFTGDSGDPNMPYGHHIGRDRCLNGWKPCAANYVIMIRWPALNSRGAVQKLTSMKCSGMLRISEMRKRC